MNEQGKFISHHLTHFTRQTFHHKSRRKRNAERDLKEKDLKDESPKKQKDTIYFSLKIKDSTLLLNVSENQHLLHPQFVVETLRKSKDIDPRRSAPLPPDQRSFLTPGTEWKCHFRGYVIDHPNSAVAISACDGLVSNVCSFYESYLIIFLFTRSSTKVKKVSHSIPSFGNGKLVVPIVVGPRF